MRGYIIAESREVTEQILKEYGFVGEIETVSHIAEGNKIVPLEMETVNNLEDKNQNEVEKDTSTEVSKEYGISNEQYFLIFAFKKDNY